MAPVVVIHGIGKQSEGGETLHSQLFPALCQGLLFAGTQIGPGDVVFADYGVVFRPPGEFLSPEPWAEGSDITDEFDEALLRVWRERAAEVDPQVPPMDAELLVRYPSWSKTAVAVLCSSAFFTKVTEPMLVGDVKQVRSYFTDRQLRLQVRGRVAACIKPDTRVVVGHSLGSVVGYEVLCSHPHWQPLSLVTLGSPLGLRNLVFDRLDPCPELDNITGKPHGAWPGSARRWTNIADQADVVAAVEDLRPLFGDEIRQVRVHNGAHAHDMSPYLTDKCTGQAIAEGLAE